MKKKDLQQHIMDVDNNHGKILVEQEKRIEELEYKVANLVRVIENNSKQWLNTPVDPKADARGCSVPFKVTCVVTGAEDDKCDC